MVQWRECCVSARSRSRLVGVATTTHPGPASTKNGGRPMGNRIRQVTEGNPGAMAAVISSALYARRSDGLHSGPNACMLLLAAAATS